MNTEPVVNLPAGEALAGHEHKLVTIDSDGVKRASTSTRVIGTLLRAPDPNDDGSSTVGKAAAVQLANANGLHFATIGNNTTIAMGDDLERGSTAGTLVKQTTGKAVAIALDASGANPSGGIIRVLMLPLADAFSGTVGADLTDNSGGTADGTLEDCNNAVTGVDGTGSNAASKADVDARLVSIANNIADLAAKVNTLLGALRG
jgi:hypothetical protein